MARFRQSHCHRLLDCLIAVLYRLEARKKRNKRTLPIFFYGYDPLVRMLAIVYLG